MTATVEPLALRHTGGAREAVALLGPEAVQAIAIDVGVCIRPVPLSVTHVETGEEQIISVPCQARLAAKCPPCAETNRRLRIWQCRAGWHLDAEPEDQGDSDQGDEDDESEDDFAEDEAGDTSDRGRRVRSTRRRDDATELPTRQMDPTTLGRIYTSQEGRRYRPSMFVTLTLPSYGRVNTGDGTPLDPGRYDYARAARDAITFGRLVDRFVQNLRRVAGYHVQYFAAVEPQRRLAAHAHFAIRGTIPRALLRQVVAATYHQVWWPPTDHVVYDGAHWPDWDPQVDGGRGGYVDPDTRQPLPTWEEALDELDTGPAAEPWHVVRFGTQVNVQGMLAGTPDADRRIGYLAKYLTKSIADCHTAETPAQTAHVEQLLAHLRWLPCSATCANWLRYGVQPKDASPGLVPGLCGGKAHQPDHLGYGGRRVLVSRKWSGKTLTAHRDERRDHVLAALGIDPGQARANDKTADRYLWQPAVTDDGITSVAQRVWEAVLLKLQWRDQREQARTRPAAPNNVDHRLSEKGRSQCPT